MTVGELASKIARLPALTNLQAAMVGAYILGLMAGDCSLAGIGPLVVWINWRGK